MNRSSLSLRWAQIRILGALMQKELIIFRKNSTLLLIRGVLWPLQKAILFGYLIPAMGLRSSYGLFFLAGILGTIPLFRITRNCFDFLYDLEHERCIEYELLLIVPRSWIIFKRMLFFALDSFAIACIAVPCGMVTLWWQADWAAISYGKIALMLMVNSLFFASFSLLCASLVATTDSLRMLWNRYIHTMWIVGCFFFSWQILYARMPLLAYLNMLNPVMYSMEGLRSAFLGASGFFSVYWCAFMLAVMSICCYSGSVMILKRRLDSI